MNKLQSSKLQVPTPKTYVTFQINNMTQRTMFPNIFTMATAPAYIMMNIQSSTPSSLLHC